ncbi:amidase [Alkalihalobacillus sp. AL-G]|uniref:amidase n=1 Tax=Alkalihalobacillus sp. AL-G TaxID=2926399 RepID=UPI00272D9E85|nr:amidase [Alkalihalobacillus sp. AL-G]WLD94777.1 amidase [Alkalihalobacillus sp. AL-G]
MSILDMDALEIAERIKNRKITSEKATQTYINHLKVFNPSVNCLVEDRFSDAIEDAKMADRLLKDGKAEGQLFGVPISIKECFDVEGMKTTGGLLHRKNKTASKDAEVVSRLKAEGAIILGKTNTPSLCYYQETENPLYGRTNNPWDLNCTAGGSSGGEGALMAAGGAAVGLGADIGGSIRFPSHFNGVVGFKSGKDQVSQDGNYPHIEFEEQQRMLGIGGMGKSVRDIRLVDTIISKKRSGRIDLSSFEMLVPQYYTSPLGVETGRIIRNLKEEVASDFAVQQDNHVPLYEESALIWQQLMSMDGGHVLRQHLHDGKKRVSPYKEFVKAKLSRSEIHPYLSWAMIGMRLFKPSTKRMDAIRDHLKIGDEKLRAYYDRRILIMPVYHSPAPEHGLLYKELFSVQKTFLRYIPYIAYANVWGLPSLVVPIGESSKGLPISIQLMSRVGNEEALFQMGEILEDRFRGYQRCNAHDSSEVSSESSVQLA